MKRTILTYASVLLSLVLTGPAGAAGRSEPPRDPRLSPPVPPTKPLSDIEQHPEGQRVRDNAETLKDADALRRGEESDPHSGQIPLGELRAQSQRGVARLIDLAATPATREALAELIKRRASGHAGVVVESVAAVVAGLQARGRVLSGAQTEYINELLEFVARSPEESPAVALLTEWAFAAVTWPEASVQELAKVLRELNAVPGGPDVATLDSALPEGIARLLALDVARRKADPALQGVTITGMPDEVQALEAEPAKNEGVAEQKTSMTSVTGPEAPKEQVATENQSARAHEQDQARVEDTAAAASGKAFPEYLKFSASAKQDHVILRVEGIAEGFELPIEVVRQIAEFIANRPDATADESSRRLLSAKDSMHKIAQLSVPIPQTRNYLMGLGLTASFERADKEIDSQAVVMDNFDYFFQMRTRYRRELTASNQYRNANSDYTLEKVAVAGRLGERPSDFVKIRVNGRSEYAVVYLSEFCVLADVAAPRNIQKSAYNGGPWTSEYLRAWVENYEFAIKLLWHMRTGIVEAVNTPISIGGILNTLSKTTESGHGSPYNIDSLMRLYGMKRTQLSQLSQPAPEATRDEGYARWTRSLPNPPVVTGDIPPATYLIVNSGSRKALGISLENPTQQSGNLAQQFDFEGVGSPYQQWKVTFDGGYYLEAVHSKLLLDAPFELGRPLPGERVHQWQPHKKQNQRWKIQPNPDGTYHILSVASGLALEAEVNAGRGGKVLQWEQGDKEHQKWLFIPVDAQTLKVSRREIPFSTVEDAALFRLVFGTYEWTNFAETSGAEVSRIRSTLDGSEVEIPRSTFSEIMQHLRSRDYNRARFDFFTFLQAKATNEKEAAANVAEEKSRQEQYERGRAAHLTSAMLRAPKAFRAAEDYLRRLSTISLEQESFLEALFVNAIAKRHILVFGVSGIGKTYTTELFFKGITFTDEEAALLGEHAVYKNRNGSWVSVYGIDGTPATRDSELIGDYDLAKMNAGQGAQRMWWLASGGKVYVFIDEFDKIDYATVASILKNMEKGEQKVGGNTVQTNSEVFVVAMNMTPEEMLGTNPADIFTLRNKLIKAFLSRVGSVFLMTPIAELESQMEIQDQPLEKYLAANQGRTPELPHHDITALRDLAMHVSIPVAVRRTMALLTRAHNKAMWALQDQERQEYDRDVAANREQPGHEVDPPVLHYRELFSRADAAIGQIVRTIAALRWSREVAAGSRDAKSLPEATMEDFLTALEDHIAPTGAPSAHHKYIFPHFAEAREGKSRIPLLRQEYEGSNEIRWQMDHMQKARKALYESLLRVLAADGKKDSALYRKVQEMAR